MSAVNPLTAVDDQRKDRVEVKYFFPLEKIDALLAYIQPFVLPDEHLDDRSPRGAYPVRSIYFDSPRMDYYWSHVEGYPHRRKVRLRIYDHASKPVYFWEIKQKMYISSKKQRWPLDERFIQQLLACRDYHDLYALGANAPDLWQEKMGFDVLHYQLRPVLMVDFKRLPFVAKMSPHVRLTVDYQMSASSMAYPLALDHQRQARALLAQRVGVLELKLTGHIPLWLQEVLLAFDLRRTAFSKYRAAVDKLFLLE